MSFLVVANFKSNKTAKEVELWLQTVKPIPCLIVAPAFPHLHTTYSILHTLYPNTPIAAQDVSPFPQGSYTGAVNATQLKSLGVTYAIVGHSERRRYFHETSSEVASKVSELVSVGITPIVCMEEPQIDSQFAALTEEHISKCLFCFEPGEIIGGTEIASLDLINTVRNKIKKYAPNSPFFYGGSVNINNIDAIIALGCEGTIISSASLDPVSFNQLLLKIPHETV